MLVFNWVIWRDHGMFRKRFHILLRENSIEVRNLGSGRLGVATGRFSHPRLLIGDFKAASRCLRDALRAAGGAGVALRHSALIQPLERLEGGLTELESSLLVRLAMANRMSDAVVMPGGRPLDYQEALYQLDHHPHTEVAACWR